MKKIIRIQFLHLFTDGTDTVAAFDAADVIKIWREMTGEKDRYEIEFDLIPDRKIIEVCSEPDDFEEMKKGRPVFSKLGKGKTFPFISAPAWAWALNNGRGFLYSTEW